jgi:hypothetical protein
MPPEGYKPPYAGAYGGDFDQKDADQGSRVYLPEIWWRGRCVPDALSAPAVRVALGFNGMHPQRTRNRRPLSVLNRKSPREFRSFSVYR